MSLPTFSELMASLNLHTPSEPESGSESELSPSPESEPSSPSANSSRSLSPAAPSQPPSLSFTPTDSPSIVVSEPDHSQPPRSPGFSRSLGRANRYSPYLGASSHVHIRRSSLPNDILEAAKKQVPDRSTSVSPRLHSNTLPDVGMSASQPPHRPRHRKVMHINVDATTSGIPISSFARRHTPQSSPTASTFHQRKRSGSFSPVLIPTLLPGLPSPHYAMEIAQPLIDVELHTSDSPRLRKGLRISSYRVAPSQPCESKIVSVETTL